jgi:hypothetical protein
MESRVWVLSFALLVAEMQADARMAGDGRPLVRLSRARGGLSDAVATLVNNCCARIMTVYRLELTRSERPL